MRGVLRAGSSRPATIRLRLEVSGLPSGAAVELTDVMLQPGSVTTGWLPHVTEMPWTAGISSTEEMSTVYARLNALEGQVEDHSMALSAITAPAQAWRGDSAGSDEQISTEWHPDLGWVSWIDVENLPGTGDTGFWFPYDETAAEPSARPARLTLRILAESLSGVDALRPRVDLMDGDVDDGSAAQVEMDPWPYWTYSLSHDFILPADRAARPAFHLIGRASGATGRVGLTRPWVGTPTERSE